MTDPLDGITSALADRYAIARELGAGGMATVYLAHDLKHDRQVAIKVLRPELAAVLGADRFLNEIKVTANLQHPNILPLYDSGQAAVPPLHELETGAGGERGRDMSRPYLYYVMAYVEGESLRDRLNREKQLGIDDTIDITKAVAAALSFAHARGVVHRDIKPENILFQAGQAMVADFGIALAVSKVGGQRLTETGLSLGTPQYMSPEQATGDRELDARSDVYSLGAVIYEMLTGEPPYTGNTMQAIVAKILSERPSPISQTRDTVPPNVEAATFTALAKTPADRFATAAQLADALTDPAFTSRTSMQPLRAAPRSAMWNALSLSTSVIALAAVVLALSMWLRPTPSSSPRQVYRVVVSLPENQRLATAGVAWGNHTFDISPDGSRLAYVARRVGEQESRLFLRSLDEYVPRELPGTEGATKPFFSPDGEWVAYFADRQLFKIPVAGGAPVPITRGPSPGPTYGASWGTDGTILYYVYRVGLFRTTADGDEPTAISLSGRTLGTEAGWPHLLPDSEHALISNGDSIGVLRLSTGEVRFVLSGSQAAYLRSGHVVFRERATLLRVVPFDLNNLEVTGLPLPASLNVYQGPGGGAALYAVSETGTLVYVAGGLDRSLVLVDRNGEETPLDVGRRGWRLPQYSPDGRRIAFSVDPAPNAIWIVDLERLNAQPVTTNAEVHHYRPIWSPDGERIAFSLEGDIVLWFRWREGSVLHRVQDAPFWTSTASWSDNDHLLMTVHCHEPYHRLSDPDRTMFCRHSGSTDGDPASPDGDLVVLNLRDSTTTNFLSTPHNESNPMLSPDGRWVAYVSNVSGQNEIYVLPFSGPGDAYLVSVGGGIEPTWSWDGTELFYRRGDRIMAVSVRTVPAFSTSEPVGLLSGPFDFVQGNNWDVGPDGRFIMVKTNPNIERQFHVVVNWFETLKAN